VETDIQLLIKTSRKEVLVGDFNAKHVTWNYRKITQQGKFYEIITIRIIT